MIRTQIQLDRDQYDRLRALAARRSQSLAQLVREGVDRVLDESDRGGTWEGLWKAVGSCHDPANARDVSVRHDEYLANAYRS
ncbi:MAG: ribbon-helix-helix protein, CopG family [Acidobacteriota bacterium]|nr:ribbon-helix-helix protein, CopG family [Acidobacteriota bacterium]